MNIQESFINEIQKISATGEQVAGAGAVAGGAVAVKKSLPLMSGRTKLYHGTEQSASKKIMKEGLKPGKTGSGITDMLGGSEFRKKHPMVYAETGKMRARTYAGQAAEIKRRTRGMKTVAEKTEAIKRFSADPIARAKSALPTWMGGSPGKKTLKLSVPLWKKEYAEKLRKNPELGGLSKKKWVAKKLLDNPMNSKASVSKYYDVLNKVKTFKGGLHTKVIKGAKGYKKLGIREIS